MFPFSLYIFIPLWIWTYLSDMSLTREREREIYQLFQFPIIIHFINYIHVYIYIYQIFQFPIIIHFINCIHIYVYIYMYVCVLHASYLRYIAPLHKASPYEMIQMWRPRDGAENEQDRHGFVVIPWPYPLVNIQKAIENGHRNSGFTYWKWWFSIVMLNYQRVILNTPLETMGLVGEKIHAQ